MFERADDHELPLDRVSEVYRGTLFASDTQQHCRDRIDWIVNAVRGPRVLDVGCSQGIGPILMAERGLDVVGVDINPRAIEFARNDALTLSPDAQSRLQFRIADITTCTEDLGEFDSIVIGEVLEHFERPEILISAAQRYLKDGGQIVITTPLGYFPSEDHKSTFTLSSFIQLFDTRFDSLSLDTSGNYIRYVGRYRRHTEPLIHISDRDLLVTCEKGLIGVQEIFHRRMAEWRSRIRVIRDQLELYRNRARERDERAREFKEKLESLLPLRQRVKELEAQLERLRVSPAPVAATAVEQLPNNSAISVALLRDVARSLQHSYEQVPGVLFMPKPFATREAPGILSVLRQALGGKSAPNCAPRLSPIDAEKELVTAYYSGGTPTVYNLAVSYFEQGAVHPEQLHRILFDLLRRPQPGIAALHGKRALELDPKNEKLVKTMQTMVEQLCRGGQVALAVLYAEILSTALVDHPEFEALWHQIASLAERSVSGEPDQDTPWHKGRAR